MIEKLPELDILELMAGVTNPSIKQNRDKLNELIDWANKREERIRALEDTMIILAGAVESGSWQGIQHEVARNVTTPTPLAENETIKF